MRRTIWALACVIAATPALGWGRKGHQTVNRLAVEALPDELQAFYRQHADELVRRAMEPDEAKRRTGAEDIYHFVDLDSFGDPKRYPRSIDEGIRKHGFDEFLRSGLLPWRVHEMMGQLADAWKAKDKAEVVRLSAWLGHYAGDAHVPLHATDNYDGQKTAQHGVHSRFESVLVDVHEWEGAVRPLLGRALVVEDVMEASFERLLDSLSHAAKVLEADRLASEGESLRPGPDGRMPKDRSPAYYRRLDQQVHGLIEDRLAKASTFAACLWYTAWDRAGRPALD